MATIEEIPLDTQETAQDIPENVEETQDIQEETVAEPPAPKKKGRPPGAKNKPKEPKAPPPTPKAKPAPKPKPRPKKKPVVEEEEYESEEEEYEPRRRVPKIDRHQLASEVLGLLQQQRYNAATRKANHYRSCFQNM